MFFSNFLDAIDQLSDIQLRYKACYEFCKYGITGELPSDEMIRMFCLGVEASVHKYQGRGGARKGAGRPKSEENQVDTGNQNIQKNQKNQKNQNTQTETETETGTERESKEKETGCENISEPDTPLLSASASNQPIPLPKDCSTYADEKPSKRVSYRWEGEVIKLNDKDFTTWLNKYSKINVRRVLEDRDDWLATQPDRIQKNWYMSTVKWLEKLNNEAV